MIIRKLYIFFKQGALVNWWMITALLLTSSPSYATFFPDRMWLKTDESLILVDLRMMGRPCGGGKGMLFQATPVEDSFHYNFFESKALRMETSPKTKRICVIDTGNFIEENTNTKGTILSESDGTALLKNFNTESEEARLLRQYSEKRGELMTTSCGALSKYSFVFTQKKKRSKLEQSFPGMYIVEDKDNKPESIYNRYYEVVDGLAMATLFMLGEKDKDEGIYLYKFRSRTCEWNEETKTLLLSTEWGGDKWETYHLQPRRNYCDNGLCKYGDRLVTVAYYSDNFTEDQSKNEKITNEFRHSYVAVGDKLDEIEYAVNTPKSNYCGLLDPRFDPRVAKGECLTYEQVERMEWENRVRE